MIQTQCYHCGLTNTDSQFHAQVLGETRYFCCPGCLAVAETIVNNGLENYYSFRSEYAQRASEQQDQLLESLNLFDEQQVSAEFVHEYKGAKEIQLSISGVNCAACGWLIEKQLSKLQGINKVGANIASKRLLLNWNDKQIKLSQILSRLRQIGYDAKPFQLDEHEAMQQRENKALLKRLGLAGLMTMQVMMLNFGVFFDWFGHIDAQTYRYFNWVSLLLSAPVALYSAAGFYHSAWRALKLRQVNMDVPISLALILIFTTGTYATVTGNGQSYFESLCMFVFLLLISRYLEQNSRFKAAQISSNLISHMPSTATLVEEGQHRVVLAKQLQVGQQVVVKAGEMVPIDGTVLEGVAQINESMLSGEFELVTKHAGDAVYAGTINQLGTLVIKVSCELNASVVAQINHLQSRAMLTKPKLANLADRFAQYFVVAVLILAGSAFLAWHFVDSERAFWIAISVLIATCPCALGLATPVSLICAIGKLNRLGVLLKRADLLEQLNQVDWIGLDKTGSLTQGKFSLQAIHNVSTLDDAQIIKLAASLEQYSSHPIADTFKQPGELYTVVQAQEVIAQGIKGNIDQREYRIGSARFINAPIPASLSHLQVYLSCDGQLLAGFALQDQIRQDSAVLLDSLRDKQVFILSGDKAESVATLASQMQIKHWFAELSPEQKLEKIVAAQQAGHTVLMLGDGINDAPVLAQADISVTLGIGSELAKSSADIILLDDSLAKLPVVFCLAQRTIRIIKQNIGWSIGYNLLVLPLAMAGMLSPLLAVLGMSASSLIVVANSIRLLKQ